MPLRGEGVIYTSYDVYSDRVKNSEQELILPCSPPPILDCAASLTCGEMVKHLASPKVFLLVLVQAGHAALGVGRGQELIESKVIRKYMVRKTQGKSQLSYLESKGKSRLGSRIRLQQSKIFFHELDRLIEGWEKNEKIDVIFLSCSAKLKGVWAEHGGMFDKADSRLRKVPLDVHRPNHGELVRVHRLLCRSASDAPSIEADLSGVFQSWSDWKRWALSDDPMKSLEASMAEDGLHAYPELTALCGVPQDPRWHPEGDVWVHTLWVVNAAKIIADREELSQEERVVLLLAALCHDLGKPGTTEIDEGRIRSIGHCELGAELSDIFLKRIQCPKNLMKTIRPLVAEHLAHASVETPTVRMVRRLEKRLDPAQVNQLIHLIEADASGRPPLAPHLPLNAARILEVWKDSDSHQTRDADEDRS